MEYSLKQFEDYVPPIKQVISKRTGKTTVAIVGFARTSHALAPYDDPETEIWSLNEGYKYPWMKRWTRWFQMHPIWDYMRKNNRNDAKHALWLQQEHDFPIYLGHVDPLIPASVRYPIEMVVRDTGSLYYTSSIAYMLALALAEKFQRIELYGVEMSSGTEYAYQRACCEYYLGMARGRGVEVYLPENCALLRGNLYGYEDIRLADRTWMELRRKILIDYDRQFMAQLNKALGQKDEAVDALNQATVDGMTDEFRTWLALRVDKRVKEAEKLQIEAAAVNGATVEMDNFIAWHDAQNIPNDREQMLRRVSEAEDLKKAAENTNAPQVLNYPWKEGIDETAILSGESPT